MAHAVVLQLRLPHDTDERDGRRILEELVIPHAQSLPGYQKGIWMRTTDAIGIAVVMFDTLANAESGAPALEPPPNGPVVVSSTIAEVDVEA